MAKTTERRTMSAERCRVVGRPGDFRVVYGLVCRVWLSSLAHRQIYTYIYVYMYLYAHICIWMYVCAGQIQADATTSSRTSSWCSVLFSRGDNSRLPPPKTNCSEPRANQTENRNRNPHPHPNPNPTQTQTFFPHISVRHETIFIFIFAQMHCPLIRTL